MGIEQWITDNSDRVKQLIIELLASLSKTTIAIIFDEKCAECSEDAKLHDCFIPFLTGSNRIRLFLKLILLGAFYDNIKQFGFAQIITNEIFESIASLHDEFLSWRKANCNNDKKIEKRKVDSYVT